MKSEIRTIGFDDSPHTRPDGTVPVVGVHMRGASRVEGLLATSVARDTRRVRYAEQRLRRLAAAVARDHDPRGVRT